MTLRLAPGRHETEAEEETGAVDSWVGGLVDSCEEDRNEGNSPRWSADWKLEISQQQLEVNRVKALIELLAYVAQMGHFLKSEFLMEPDARCLVGGDIGQERTET